MLVARQHARDHEQQIGEPVEIARHLDPDFACSGLLHLRQRPHAALGAPHDGRNAARVIGNQHDRAGERPDRRDAADDTVRSQHTVVATDARGLVYGNRGCLHDAEGRIVRTYQVKRWIACRLEFRGRRRSPLMQPGRYTELFFLDDATALAAGHRPCGECRRDDYTRFAAFWRRLHGEAGVDAIDGRLHGERIDPATRARLPHPAPFETLPDGAFVLYERTPHLVRGARLLRWDPAGYVSAVERPQGGEALTVTPPSLVELLRSGWEPTLRLLHPSADAPVHR